MSDGGSSGGLSGTFELVGQAAKSGAQGLAKGVGNLGTSAMQQVAGSGGVSASPNMSGSFDLNPAGGADLFSPDVQKPGNNAKQMFGNTKPLTQAGQNAVAQDRVYTPDELEKIQSIESELRSMHKQNNDIESDMEKVRREREEKYQEKIQNQAQPQQPQQMEDLPQPGQVQDPNAYKAARGTELAKGDQG